nr:Chain B, Potassium/sodium hyperpolarization-activated cyclic nucleotide-gated channel 2 [Mus musculus]
SRLSSNL